MERIPLETQTLYAELLNQLTVLEAQRSIGSLKGGFTTKVNRGQTYYYFQYSEPGGVRKQRYIGRESQALSDMVKAWESEKAVTQSDQQSIQRLCAQLRAGGAITTSHAHARVLGGLADSGVFRMGGVLIGTHAFAAMGNLLGVRWERAGLQTQDVDIASERDLHLVLSDRDAVDLPDTLARLQMGFLPVPALRHDQPSTSFKVRNSPLTVDVLTPARKRSEEYRTVDLPTFATKGLALPYLDYLIESPQPAAVINGGGVLVNIPDPARFGLHKIMVAEQRPTTDHVKRNKDLRQAVLLIELLAEERPGDLQLAWEKVASRGPSWKGRLRKGLARFLEFAPQLEPAVAFMKGK